MTNLEKLEANERKQQLIESLNYTCQVCNKQFTREHLHLAHKIPKYGRHLKKWGEKIINHPLNLVLTCDSKNGKCNDSVMVNPNDNYGKALLLVIKADILAK